METENTGHRRGGERDQDSFQDQRQASPTEPSCAAGGYDCEFVERPPIAFQRECPVCLLVLREPHQVTCCGYSFCATCIKRVQEDKNNCPACNQADFTVFLDLRLKWSLNECLVYCSRRAAGCDWTGELRKFDGHLNLQPQPDKLLVGCPLSEIECTYCGLTLQRRYVQAHQSEDCLKRPYTCEHCNKCSDTFEEVTQNHWPVCPFFPVCCPNNCEILLPRQEVDHHVSQDRPLSVIECCNVKFTRKNLPSHISENLTEHVCMQHKMLIQLQCDNQQLRNDNQQLQQALEQKLQSHEATLNQHQKTLEKVTYTGTLPFEFTITEFEMCPFKNSPHFYTHTHGYKMYISICADARNILVIFNAVKGKYDDNLLWPFQGTVTLQLLNQLDERNHHT